MTRQSNFLTSDRLIKGILTLNILVFAASLILSGKGTRFTLNPFSAFSPSNSALIFLGATGTLPIDRFHAWWSLVSASWLHGSLVHILFNMSALIQIAPLIINEFGLYRMIIIYVLSGIAGFYLSYLAGVPLTIGASAPICGLIGAALYFGKSRGGNFGQMVFKQTSGWIVGLVLFGLLVPSINNWGHGGGVLAGIGLGWSLGYLEKSPETLVHRFLAWVCMGVTLATLCWSVGTGIYLSL
ncbi:MAG: rhomboid family intramembrane serine protease [Pseudomonadota bacterium]